MGTVLCLVSLMKFCLSEILVPISDKLTREENKVFLTAYDDVSKKFRYAHAFEIASEGNRCIAGTNLSFYWKINHIAISLKRNSKMLLKLIE